MVGAVASSSLLVLSSSRRVLPLLGCCVGDSKGSSTGDDDGGNWTTMGCSREVSGTVGAAVTVVAVVGSQVVVSQATVGVSVSATTTVGDRVMDNVGELVVDRVGLDVANIPVGLKVSITAIVGLLVVVDTATATVGESDVALVGSFVAGGIVGAGGATVGVLLLEPFSIGVVVVVVVLVVTSCVVAFFKVGKYSVSAVTNSSSCRGNASSTIHKDNSSGVGMSVDPSAK